MEAPELTIVPVNDKRVTEVLFIGDEVVGTTEKYWLFPYPITLIWN